MQKASDSTITIFTDGGARGNPGPAAIGVHGEFHEKTLFELSLYIGQTTNNTAEYEALLQASTWLSRSPASPFSSGQKKPTRVQFFLDSLLVVQQMSGTYKVKQPHILEYVRKIHIILDSLKLPYIFTHIPRDKNARADTLVNAALDAEITLR